MSLTGKASDSRTASETPSSKRNRGAGPMPTPAEPYEQELPARRESGRISNVVYKRSWRELFLHEGVESGQRKKKNQKERTVGRGRLWKLPQPRKSFKVAYGSIFLMISSAAWKTLLGFPQLPQARRRLHPLQINWRRQSLDSVTFLGEAIRVEF